MRRKVYGLFDFQFEAAMRDSHAAGLKLVYNVNESVDLSLYLYLPIYFFVFPFSFLLVFNLRWKKGGIPQHPPVYRA